MKAPTTAVITKNDCERRAAPEDDEEFVESTRRTPSLRYLLQQQGEETNHAVTTSTKQQEARRLRLRTTIELIDEVLDLLEDADDQHGGADTWGFDSSCSCDDEQSFETR